jgi:hypothetical protein
MSDYVGSISERTADTLERTASSRGGWMEREARPVVIVETFHLDGSDDDAARALGLYADTHRIAHAMLPEPGYSGRARVVWERR